MKNIILSIRGLNISFTQYTHGLRQRRFNVINNLSLDVFEGEILAIIGASGSGKSLLAHSIFGVLPTNASVDGKIFYKGDELSEDKLNRFRGKELFLIPQTINSLDPLQPVYKQVQNMAPTDKVSRQRSMFLKLNLSEKVEKLFPRQLSGGMARRVLISTALVSDAKLLVADEPMPGMDVESVNGTLMLLKNVIQKGATIVIILHDIQTALKIADRIAVFKDGSIVDIVQTEYFEGEGTRLSHPYTRLLWNALPQNKFSVV